MISGVRRATGLANSLIMPRAFPLASFRRTDSLDGLKRWVRHHPLFARPAAGFNGDLLRARIVVELFRSAACTAFIETGTYRGSTSILASRLLGCPVLTCELVARHSIVARLRALGLPRIRFHRSDSRSFLRRLASRPESPEVPMFYLDAHWYEDCPLDEEIRIVRDRWSRYVVVIDDFRVPGRDDFGFDSYGGRPLALEMIGRSLEGGAGAAPRLYFPRYAAQEDCGLRRGYLVIVGGVDDRLSPARSRFPLDLLERHAT